MGNNSPNIAKFQALSLQQQGIGLKAKFPESNFKVLKNLLIWEGWVRPRAEGRKYLLCLNYIVGESPRVWVVDPPLHESTKKLPHVYAGNRLCLFQPKEWLWSKSKRIASFIIPWATLWIYYYEIYEITGVWEGGGDHPGEDDSEDEEEKSKKKSKRRRFVSAYNSNKCTRLSASR